MKISDHFQREHALNPRHSFIIQAPAGSGKTELLTQRFLVLLATVKYPEEIIALTFTRKAAAEMRKRIINALNIAEKTTEPENDYAAMTWSLAKQVLKNDTAHSWKLIQNPSRLRIQTIDSLCASLASQLPIQSQFGALPDISEYPTQLYRQAAQEILETLEIDQPWSQALQTLLAHLDNKPDVFINLVAEMLAKREQWLDYVVGSKQQENLKYNLEKFLKNICVEHIKQLQGYFSLAQLQECLDHIKFSAENLPQAQIDSSMVLYSDYQSWPDDEIAALPLWQAMAGLLLTKDKAWRKSINKSIGFPAPSTAKSTEDKQRFKSKKLELSQLIEDLTKVSGLHEDLVKILTLPAVNYQARQWQILEALLTILPIAVAQLKLIFKQNACVDFNEVTYAALNALGTAEQPTDLVLILDHKIQHLLIDEFQDTSIQQFKLVEQLCAGWQQNDGRSLFIVGDPMQSIYKFRNAEVGLFIRVREYGLGNLELKSLNLSSNFRSEAGIIDWINDNFSHILPDNDNISDGAISYSSAIATKAFATEPAVEQYAFEDELVAADYCINLVKKIQNKNPEQDIAILVRSRNHLDTIIRKLNQQCIDYNAVDFENLSTYPYIIDLLSLTKAILHPADKLAWLSVLRAPFCGLSLSDLHAIANYNIANTLFENLQQHKKINALSQTGQQCLSRIIPILTASLVQRYRLSLRKSVEDLWCALGGPACLSDKNALENTDKFFNLLAKLEDGGDVKDFTRLSQQLNLLFALKTGDSNCKLHILTIHKAKGLEFDHVILPAIHKTTAPCDMPLLRWLEKPNKQGETELILAPIKEFSTQTDSIYRYIQTQWQMKEQFELGRLFYVASTRAKRKLYLFACKKTTEDFKAPKNSFLGLLPLQTQQQFEYIASEQQNIIDNQDTGLFRLALNWQPPQMVANNILSTEKHLDYNQLKQNAEIFTEFIANNSTAKKIGIIIHQCLQQLSLHRACRWQHLLSEDLLTFAKNRLIEQVVPSNDIPTCLDKIKAALINTINDDRGRWILQPHSAAASEYPLTIYENGQAQNIVIDRTFIDENNYRWIIDYKSSTTAESFLDRFLQIEYEKYSPQLQKYVKAFQLLEQRPIKLGLYFPLCRGWIQKIVSNQS